MNTPRVVVTGYGMITPLGLTADSTWQALLAGTPGVGPITLFDASGFEVQTAAEVKHFDPAAMLGHKPARRMDRFEQFANVAASEALAHSGLAITEHNGGRIGQTISSAFGGLMSMVHQIGVINARGPREVDPLGLTRFMTTTPSISIAHGLRGPSFSVASACATGADGIGMALMLLRSGRVDAMLAGGADAGITSLSIATFDRMRALSRRPEATPSPFSADRDGMVMGEGGAALVLETLDHALSRGAHILAELVGYGATSDAHHIVAPPEDGHGAAAAIRAALSDAGLSPAQVDHINAHGTGTAINDSAETQAIKTALGERAYDVPISATKSMTGHMMGGTGAAEAIFCIQAIQNGIVPPTINYQGADPACDLDYVPNAARAVEVNVAMSHSFGFGGHNSVLVFRRYDG
jgi:beta-ketoacyl-acyl-carrier-protein synthase II